MRKYKVIGVRGTDGSECRFFLRAENEAEALAKSKEKGVFPTNVIDIPLDVEEQSEESGAIRDENTVPNLSQSRPLVYYGGVLLAAGLLGIAQFGFFYDTTVTATSGGYLGVPAQTHRVHNIGKQQNRMLGFIFGIAAAGIGVVLLALDVHQNSTKKDV